MKHLFFFNSFLIILFFLPVNRPGTTDNLDTLSAIRQKKIQSIRCYPDLKQENLLPDDAMSMIPLPGWGKHQWKLNTRNDSCQFYFNQGINMYYSFHIIEALASFKKARTIDSNSAMSWWGEALAYGPNINDVEYAAAPDAYLATQTAARLSNNATAREKGLIKAMLLRYSLDTTLTRSTLNLRYQEAMRALYQQYPQDIEVGTLYADAIMLVHPWDLYDDQSSPKPWTPELTGILEKMIRLSPNHPGANHYYIHAVEASLHPEKAKHSATVLPGLMPKVSHVVHMPSHIYIRTGEFEKGMDVNIQANKGYSEYLALMPQVVNNSFLYLMHNIHMQATCAMMSGDADLSAATALQCRKDVPADYLTLPAPTGDYVQYMYMTPVFSMIRYGKWKELLEMPEVPDSLAYAKIIFHFGRGIALARQQEASSAKQELEKLQNLLNKVPSLKMKMGAFNSAYDGGTIAENILSGVIAEAENNYGVAADFLKKAVDTETRLVYNEPRDWILPAREYLGAVLLKDKQWSEAELEFRKDLVVHPGNSWAENGLIRALEGQGKNKEASKLKADSKTSGKGKKLNFADPVF